MEMREIPCDLSDAELLTVRGALLTVYVDSKDQFLVNAAAVMYNHYGAVMDYRAWKKSEGQNGS